MEISDRDRDTYVGIGIGMIEIKIMMMLYVMMNIMIANELILFNHSTVLQILSFQ
jgi:hypothetical protein